MGIQNVEVPPAKVVLLSHHGDICSTTAIQLSRVRQAGHRICVSVPGQRSPTHQDRTPHCTVCVRVWLESRNEAHPAQMIGGV